MFRKEYLKYESIKNFKDGKIKIKCYFNGAWWVCPNPLDEYRSILI